DARAPDVRPREGRVHRPAGEGVRMRLAIVGSRGFTNLSLVRRYVVQMPDVVTCVISGGAKGVDRCAASVAEARGLEVVEHLPDWKGDGRRPALLRNHRIIDDADQVVAFWDLSSTGTAHTIQLARMAGKLRRIFSPEGPWSLEAPR